MKKIEIIDVYSNRSRLTVTPDRVTIKLKNDLSQEEKDKLVKFSLQINEKMTPTDKSWRGRFQDFSIKLWLDNNQESKLFKFEELC